MKRDRQFVLRVFEHQHIRIGEMIGETCFTRKLWEELRAFQLQQARPFYRVLADGIAFSSYVGAIQTGEGHIEIWPKTDQSGQATWQPFLLELLSACRYLPVFPNHTGAFQPSAYPLTTLYLLAFISELEKYLAQGPARRYGQEVQTGKVWKGSIKWAEQFRRQFTHADQVVTVAQVYGPDHLHHRIIKLALRYAVDLLPPSANQAKAVGMLGRLQAWGEILPGAIDWRLMEHSQPDKSLGSLMGMSKAIITGYSGGIQSGQTPLMALLFDMNLLFESYIYEQLASLRMPGLSVRRQPSSAFWLDRILIPDIVLQYHGKKWVLDTKWKILAQAKPAMDDLRQLYVYMRYFHSGHGALIYPRFKSQEDIPPTPYADSETFAQVCFVSICEQGRLNRSLGEKLMLQLTNQLQPQ